MSSGNSPATIRSSALVKLVKSSARDSVPGWSLFGGEGVSGWSRGFIHHRGREGLSFTTEFTEFGRGHRGGFASEARRALTRWIRFLAFKAALFPPCLYGFGNSLI